jgi:hypothetical protein
MRVVRDQAAEYLAVKHARSKIIRAKQSRAREQAVASVCSIATD